ncbi:MAG TPA: enolase C-terminal domain-like protein [Jatrophihabitans sp.]|nr:enolase C-terminal domain-like protein [Jatrophihabitans sp.]
MTDRALTATIDGATIGVYRFPTPQPEADGTLSWDATVAVTVQLHAGGFTGLGWTYSSPAAAAAIQHHLLPAVRGHDVADIAGGWEAMRRAARNLGTKGLVMQALSAVDVAWWDLKARLVHLPVGDLLGRCRNRVPVYGSGGFTSMTDAQLAQQVEQWQAAGCTAMKIKIGELWGSRVERDIHRIDQLRQWAGDQVTLMVDANGAYSVGRARRVGVALDSFGVTWFEEPVSSDDLAGLATVRAAVHCDVAAGEYASDSYDIAGLLPVVDCLQLDATRCGGYTGWLAGAALARARNLEVSAHCAPALHAPVAAAVPHLRHVEWFADHVRLEPLLLDGVPPVRDGELVPDLTSPGHGMHLSEGAERFLASPAIRC